MSITELPPPDPLTRVTPAAPEAPDHGSLIRLVPVVALLAFAWLRGGWEIVAVIGLLLLMIFLHEVGHYATAKWSGMKVTEFFLGFGPKIWSFRRGDTEYGLKAIPAGAYVKVPGMYSFEEVQGTEESRTFRAQPTWQRVLMASGGSLMHFAQAFVAIIVLFVTVGLPNFDRFAVRALEVDAPAMEAGLQLGDEVVSVDGVELDRAGISDAITKSQGNTLVLGVVRDGEPIEVVVTPEVLEVAGETTPRFRIGVTVDGVIETGSFGDAVSAYGDQFTGTISGLGNLFSPGGLKDYSNLVFGREETAPSAPGQPASEPTARPTSVIGIVDQGSQLVEDGWSGVLAFYIGINIAIGIFNLIPLLPFDGGHIVIALYEKVRSRRGRRHYADVQKMLPLTYVVVMLLLLLVMSSMYLDIKDI